jgi:hypothetical protein
LVEKSVKTPYHIFYLKKVKQTKTFFCGSNEQKSFYQKVEKIGKFGDRRFKNNFLIRFCSEFEEATRNIF